MVGFRKFGWIALVFAWTLFISLTSAQAGPIVLKAASPYPLNHYLTKDAFEWYGHEIEKRTRGRVKFKWFHAGSIAPWPQSYPAVTNGLCDFGVGGTVFHIRKLPITMGLNLPFITDSAKHASLVAYEMFTSIPQMRKEYQKVKVLGLYSTATVNLHSTTPPLKTLESLKGVRIGAAAPNVVQAMKLLGASAQPVKPQDLYMAIQRHMIEGIVFPDAPLRSMKLTDLLSNHTMVNMFNASFGVFMNRNSWKKLSKDVQAVFEDLTVSMGALCGETLDNEAAWVIEEMKKRGDQFYYLPPEEKARWRAAVSPMYEGWIQLLNKHGMDGKAIFQQVVDIAEKYRKHPYGKDAWWGNAGKKR